MYNKFCRVGYSAICISNGDRKIKNIGCESVSFHGKSQLGQERRTRHEQLRLWLRSLGEQVRYSGRLTASYFRDLPLPLRDLLRLPRPRLLHPRMVRLSLLHRWSSAGEAHRQSSEEGRKMWVEPETRCRPSRPTIAAMMVATSVSSCVDRGWSAVRSTCRSACSGMAVRACECSECVVVGWTRWRNFDCRICKHTAVLVDKTKEKQRLESLSMRETAKGSVQLRECSTAGFRRQDYDR